MSAIPPAKPYSDLSVHLMEHSESGLQQRFLRAINHFSATGKAVFRIESPELKTLQSLVQTSTGQLSAAGESLLKALGPILSGLADKSSPIMVRLGRKNEPHITIVREHVQADALEEKAATITSSPVQNEAKNEVAEGADLRGTAPPSTAPMPFQQVPLPAGGVTSAASSNPKNPSTGTPPPPITNS